MDIQTCKFLAQYNHFANNGMNAFVGKLDDDQWNKDFGGYFKSIKELCNHIYLADFNWLKRFSRLRTFDYIKDSLFDRDLAFGTNPMAEVSDYLQKREALDKKLIQFVDELRGEDLDMPLKYADSKGEYHTKNFGLLVFHVFNHSTHHRGMVSVYMDAMNIENDFSNAAALA